MIPGSGRSPGVGNGNPLQYACLGNPMDRGAWWATVRRVVELDTTKRLRPQEWDGREWTRLPLPPLSGWKSSTGGRPGQARTVTVPVDSLVSMPCLAARAAPTQKLHPFLGADEGRVWGSVSSSRLCPSVHTSRPWPAHQCIVAWAVLGGRLVSSGGLGLARSHPLQQCQASRPPSKAGKWMVRFRGEPAGKAGNPAVLPLLKSSWRPRHPITTRNLIIKSSLPVTSQHGSNSSSLEAFFVYFYLFI